MPAKHSHPLKAERRMYRLVRALPIVSLLLMFLSACGLIRSEPIQKIALLAPFESRYREIGYDALYATRLAIADSGLTDVQLLAVDDGGSIESATDRIRALNIDPDVRVILTLGPFTTQPDVQQANDKPLIIIGFWGYSRADDDTLIASNPEIAERVTTVEDITDVNVETITWGSDLYALNQVPDIVANLENLRILSSGSLPDQAFGERYIHSDLYVPEPGLLTTLIYDISRLVLASLANHTPLDKTHYTGINGDISFTAGYWNLAPINRYQYIDSELVAITD